MSEKHFKIIPESQFILDARKWSKSIPSIWDEIQGVADIITETGEIPDECDPHGLSNTKLNYVGYDEFHLLDDNKISILVIYKVVKNKKIIRFIRLGTHGELFHGYLK